MELGRALVSLEIGLACKLFVAAVDAARPHGGVGGFLRGGSVLVLRLFLVGLPLLVGLRSDWDWPIQRTNATTMGYALSALFVGPSRFRLAQISQCQSTASSVSRWLRERWLMIPGDLGRGVRWQLLWPRSSAPKSPSHIHAQIDHVINPPQRPPPPPSPPARMSQQRLAHQSSRATSCRPVRYHSGCKTRQIVRRNVNKNALTRLFASSTFQTRTRIRNRLQSQRQAETGEQAQRGRD